MELIFAYIDPGSGSLVIQALIAGMVAVPVIFRRQSISEAGIRHIGGELCEIGDFD